MTTFAVTYREKNGARAELEIAAADRAACMAECRRRGIAPVKVVEARVSRGMKDGASGRLPAPGKLPPEAAGRGRLPSRRLAAAAVLLVAVLGGAWWWLARTPPAPVPPKVSAPVKEKPVRKPDPPKQKTDAAPAVATNGVAVATNEVKEAAKPKERHDTVSIHTNNMGKVVEKWIGADGKLHMSVRYARKPVFDNASDDQLAMAVGGEGTREIPPIPMAATSEQEFLESLKKPIEIAEDDPEEVKRLKQAVSEARAEMKALMDRGMSYREALAEHQRLVNENVDTRNQCMAELKSLVDAGDREGAEHYLKTMNVALEQMGIPALTMPMSREELNAARQRRKEEREAAKQGGK